MKSLILLTMLLSSAVVVAEPLKCELNKDGSCTVQTEKLKKAVETVKTPEAFENSKIKRRLKDGSTQEFDGNDYQIVPRQQERYKKVVESINVPANSSKKRMPNRLSLLLGVGPEADMSRAQGPATRVVVEHENVPVIGLQYMRDIMSLSENVDLSVLGQIQSNESALIGLGVAY
jgi:hypothetical protein